MRLRQNETPELSPAEWVVMNKVWALKKAGVREVYEELRDAEGWAYNTVRTMMERMREKGYLEAGKSGNRFLYSPKISRRHATAAALERFVTRVFDGAVGPMFAGLIEREKLSPEERDRLKRLLEERRDEGGADNE